MDLIVDHTRDQVETPGVHILVYRERPGRVQRRDVRTLDDDVQGLDTRGKHYLGIANAGLHGSMEGGGSRRNGGSVVKVESEASGWKSSTGSRRPSISRTRWKTTILQVEVTSTPGESPRHNGMEGVLGRMTLTDAGAKAHWLTVVAGYAGIEEPELPEHPSLEVLAEAWEQVAGAAGGSSSFLGRVAKHFKLPVAILATSTSEARGLVSFGLARDLGILPLRLEGNRLVIATADPDTETGERLRRITGRTIVFELANPADLDLAVDRAYSTGADTILELVEAVAHGEESETFGKGGFGGTVFTSDMETHTGPVVRLVDAILESAVGNRATAVHCIPGSPTAYVRLRVDGVLRDLVELPVPAYRQVTDRIRSLVRLEDGAVGRPEPVFCEIDGAAVELKTSSVATADGDKLVLQLIRSDVRFRLDLLGMATREAEALQRIMDRPRGLVLVAGTARTGKTTLLYSALAELASRGLSVATLESPLEHSVPGLDQTAFDPAEGSFGSQLGRVLDHDADVIFAGEIRDLETARLCLRASLTGRGVWASVHAPDAARGVERLLNMGLDAGRLAESLSGVVSQRLVRRLCSTCTEQVLRPGDLSPRELALAQAVRVKPSAAATGCPECSGTGYLGLLPVTEVMVVDEALKTAIESGLSAGRIEAIAHARGMRRVIDAALDRIESGDTTLTEVERVVGIPMGGSRTSKAGPVIIVEDNPDDRLIMRTVIEKGGLRVVEAPDAAKGLEALAKHPDAAMVLLDLGLPDMDGLTFLRRVRSSGPVSKVRVIVVTGSEDPADEIKLIQSGADDFITKPVQPARLAVRVDAALRRI